MSSARPVSFQSSNNISDDILVALNRRVKPLLKKEPPKGTSAAPTDMVSLTNLQKIVPLENDVLCGKTRQCLVHHGSVQFRYLIESYTDRYEQAEDKYSKMSLTREIFQRVSQSSRFLRFNRKESAWEELTPAVARDKVGHALRFSSLRRSKKSHRSKAALSARCPSVKPPAENKSQEISVDTAPKVNQMSAALSSSCFNHDITINSATQMAVQIRPDAMPQSQAQASGIHIQSQVLLQSLAPSVQSSICISAPQAVVNAATAGAAQQAPQIHQTHGALHALVSNYARSLAVPKTSESCAPLSQPEMPPPQPSAVARDTTVGDFFAFLNPPSSARLLFNGANHTNSARLPPEEEVLGNLDLGDLRGAAPSVLQQHVAKDGNAWMDNIFD